MKIVFKILAILLIAATVGQFIAGNVWFIGIILAIIFSYLGWRESTNFFCEEEKRNGFKCSSQCKRCENLDKY